MERPYQLTDEAGQLVLRVDRDRIDPAALARVLDFIELEAVRRRSALTQAQAEGLAEEIDGDVWERVKHRYPSG